LNAKNLYKKTDKGHIEIKKDIDTKVYDYIRAKDTVFFELEFTEIWLEVEMELFCDERSMTYVFELKVETGIYISELRHILIKLGIKSWIKYIDDLKSDSDKSDYYLFCRFMLDLNNEGRNLEYIELDNLHGIYLLIFRKNRREA
jgi:hypothetical protein